MKVLNAERENGIDRRYGIGSAQEGENRWKINWYGMTGTISG